MKVLQWILAIVLAAAAVAKIVTPATNQTMFGALPLYLRAGLISLELLIALWLISGFCSKHAALVTVALFSVFAGAILLEMRRAQPHPCGCLGPAASPSGNPALVRGLLAVSLFTDVLLATGAGWIYFTASAKSLKPDSAVPS